MNLFYERSVAIASVLAGSRSLVAIVADLKTVIVRSGRTDLLNAVSQLEAQLDGARDQVARIERPYEVSLFSDAIAAGATPQTVSRIELRRSPDDRLREVQDGDDARAYQNLERAGRESVAVSDRVSEELEAWSDRQLSMELARTRVAALSTQLNTNVAVLNKFEIEKAKYGGYFGAAAP